MSLLPATVPLSAGTTFFNKYQLIGPIGGGGFGDVWLADDRTVNHRFAVKILKPGLSVDAQLTEAKVGHAFTHNNLVRVHQADVTTDGRVVIAMDYHAAGAITTLANPANFVPLPQVLRATIDILQGLEHLHSLNVFHNDIKTENILLGEHGQAILTDYGIVGISPTGGPVAPPNWYVLHAAPEVSNGTGIDARTDIFQVGLTMFRLLVGLPTLEAIYRTVGKDGYVKAISSGELLGPPDFPHHVPGAVRRIISKAISVNPDNRYQSALEMRRTLEKLSYAGHWTVGPDGKPLGIGQSHEYTYDCIKQSSGKFAVSASKTNTRSERTTAVKSFSEKNLGRTAAEKLVAKFVKAVIEGI